MNNEIVKEANMQSARNNTTPGPDLAGAVQVANPNTRATTAAVIIQRRVVILGSRTAPVLSKSKWLGRSSSITGPISQNL
jgi:hypothetical protein